MILKPCPFCQKNIPRSITVCPYCHKDEQGKPVVIDSANVETPGAERVTEGELKEISHEDPFTRDQAVLRMAQRGNVVVPALVSILNDFSKPRLAGVASALGKIGDPRAIPVLAQAAKVGDEDLRIAAIRALSQFHTPEVLPILLAEAERPHPVIQSYLANALGTFQDKRVLPVLSKLVEHPNREVAFQAACALAETGDRDGASSLKRAWRTKDPLVRAASAASLKRLGARPSIISARVMVIGLGLLAALGAGAGFLFYK